MAAKIVVGAAAMFVERHGIRSEVRALSETDGPAEIRAIAADLWQSIRRAVSWKVWLAHRAAMASQRSIAAIVRERWPGPYHPGPRPDLLASRPWSAAKRGEWLMLPPGVVGRLLRGEKR